MRPDVSNPSSCAMRRGVRAAVALLLPLPVVFAVACGSPHHTDAPQSSASPPECGAGTRPTAPDATCAPVGPIAVPDGFAPRASGWGFEPVLPSAPCTGATMARLGASSCESIDDGAAIFPPKEATFAVSQRATAFAGRADLPVFPTLAEALAQAHAGDTIAVDDGEYDAAPIAISVRIVGRSAATTALHGDDFGFRIASGLDVHFTSLAFTGAPKAALLIDKHAKVTLERVYFHGDNDAIEIGNGATVTASKSIFEGPAASPRPFATNGVHVTYGGHATLRDVELRGYQGALYAESVGSTLEVSRSVIHEERALAVDPAELAQVSAFTGAKVTIEESHVESQRGRIAGVGARRLDGTNDPTSPGNPPASLTITRSSLVHALVPREDGSAIDGFDGASIDLDDVTLAHESFTGVGLSGGASIALRRSVVLGGASMANARSAINVDDGSVTLDSAAIVDATQFAIIVKKGAVTLDGSLIQGTVEIGRFDPRAFLGSGQAIAVGPGAQLSVHASALVGNEGTTVSLTQASAKIDETVITATKPTKLEGITCALLGIDSVLAIERSVITHNQVGLALSGGRALVRESAVADHREAFRLEAMTLVVTDDASVEAAASQVVASATHFDRNDVLSSTKPLTDE
jgi:hypothetical protein